MNRHAVLVAVAAMVCSMVAPTVADAARPATPDEAAQIARDLELEPDCWTVVVSTARTPDKYARIDGTGQDGCVAGNGFRTATTAAMHDGFWGEWFSANNDSRTYCEDNDAPWSVGRDLKICHARARPTELRTLDGIKIKPKRVLFGGRHYFRGVRWSTWNRQAARGRGTLDYADRTSRIVVPVTIRLSRPTVCPDGARLFTRAVIRAVRPSDARRIQPLVSGRELLACDARDR